MTPAEAGGSQAGRVIAWALLLGLFLPATLAAQAGGDTPSTDETSPSGGDVATLEAAPSPDAEDEHRRSADRRTTELLRHRLEQMEGLGEIEVEVRYGIAVLDGRALGFDDADRAAEVAAKTDGVVAVENRVKIETDLEERVRPAYDRSLERLHELASYLPLLLLGLAILAVFYLFSRWARTWRGLYRRASESPFIQNLLEQLTSAVIMVIGLVVVLEILDATALVGAVLGSVGVFGVALGFAFRDLVENYISSVLLSLRRPFAPDDHVVIGDFEGKVIRLTSRATILMTLDGNHLRIPNADVFKGVILNYSRNPRRRFQFDVGVGVNEDLLDAQHIGVEQLLALEGVLADPAPEALIVELGDSNVVIRFYGWVDQRRASFFKVKAEAIRRVKLHLESAGMDLPEPIYRVVLQRRPKPQATLAAAPPEDETPNLEAGEAIDEQIAEDRRLAGAPDLLDTATPEE